MNKVPQPPTYEKQFATADMPTKEDEPPEKPYRRRAAAPMPPHWDDIAVNSSATPTSVPTENKQIGQSEPILPTQPLKCRALPRQDTRSDEDLDTRVKTYFKTHDAADLRDTRV